MADFVLTFDELPPGLNGPGGLLRMHWTQRRELASRWCWIVRERLELRQGVPAFDRQHPCILRARRRCNSLMDFDNFGASLKPVLDALVHNSILADDSPLVVQKLILEEERGRPAQLILVLRGVGD